MKKIITATIILLTLAMTRACPAGAAIDLEAAKKNIQSTLDAARDAEDTPESKNDLKSMIRYSLHILRGPGADGLSYRYATVDMGAGVKPEMIGSYKPNAVWEKDLRQTIAVEGSTIVGFQIYMPLQRGFFKNNGNMFLDGYKLEYMLNGEKKSQTFEYRRWLNRDTAIDVPIPGIAEWARLEMTVAVAQADLDHVFAHVLAKRPLVKDDPSSPFAYVVGRLNDALSRLEDDRLPREVVKCHEEALAGIAQIPADLPTSNNASLNNDKTVAALRNILRLLEGDLSEQDQGMQELRKLIDTLK